MKEEFFCFRQELIKPISYKCFVVSMAYTTVMWPRKQNNGIENLYEKNR